MTITEAKRRIRRAFGKRKVDVTLQAALNLVKFIDQLADEICIAARVEYDARNTNADGSKRNGPKRVQGDCITKAIQEVLRRDRGSRGGSEG